MSEPSPPIATRLVIRLSTRFWAARRRPSLCLKEGEITTHSYYVFAAENLSMPLPHRKSLQRADPMTVPPLWMMPETSAQCASQMFSPPSTMPCSQMNCRYTTG